MGKGKKKKNLSETVRSKKKDATKKVNPFEVKVNKQKHDVLGRKLTKHDKGMPGVSRSKANKKRKETLLVEFQQRSKANKFVDRRFGETDPEMSIEDKMLQRFALEKQKTHEKGNLFSLNEEEDELTHYGQSLSQIEKFEDVPLSDDDEEDRGKIGADIVAQEHFGGFLTKKDEAGEGADTKPKSWKERMEEIIAKSKKEKYERQKEKEQANELTEKLDQEWKGLMGLTWFKKREEYAEAKADDYDIAVRELKFEMTGTPSDRLKTEEELAKEEKEKLEKLEADRLRRMKGLTDEDTPQDTHRSADDLDDQFALDKPDRKGKKVKFSVSYKDGKLEKSDSEEEEGDEDEDQDDKEEEEGSDEEGDEAEEDDEDDDDDEDDSEDDAMERTSDLESDEEEEEEEKAEPKKTKGALKGKSILKKTELVAPKEKKDFQRVLKERKEMMEAARKELPYTFPAPEKYEDLLQLLEGHGDADQLTIITRLQKCLHPSLAEGNKDKLESLFTYLVEYFGDLAVQDPPHLSLMDKLVPHIHTLCTQSSTAGAAVIAMVCQRQQEFQEYAEARGGKGSWPKLDVLMLLKLVSLLFPTSDFHHHVVTPTMLFMSQLITQCAIGTRSDIASGLLLCNLFLEYVSFSKRFVPEVINFLNGVLFLAMKKEQNKIEPVIPPFKPLGRSNNFLELQTGKKAKKIKVEPVKLSDVFSKSKSAHLGTDEFKLGCIHQCLQLLQSFCDLYKDLPAFEEIFSPVTLFCCKLPVENYPQTLQDLQTSLLSTIAQHSGRPRGHLMMSRKKPLTMKLYEPKFDEVFDGKKKRGGSREQNEKARLVHKHKKELKGAIREVRKDSHFLARAKLNETMAKDAERKRKVNQIYQQLATQEGDYKALKRKKDSMKE